MHALNGVWALMTSASIIVIYVIGRRRVRAGHEVSPQGRGRMIGCLIGAAALTILGTVLVAFGTW